MAIRDPKVGNPLSKQAYLQSTKKLTQSFLKASIREAAASTLSVCLELIQARESQLRIQKYRKILDEAQKCLKMPSPDAVHGGLLTYRELLEHTGNVGGSSGLLHLEHGNDIITMDLYAVYGQPLQRSL